MKENHFQKVEGKDSLTSKFDKKGTKDTLKCSSWQPNKETSIEVKHTREDSGYRSDRKVSGEYINDNALKVTVATKPISSSLPNNVESDTDEEDFDWGDPYLNSRRCSLVLRTQTALRVKTIIG
uniref:Ovule protein n=1 Tax=Heterorhabditis bacteriophora TaxID=37862 RepID=A0A1I7XET3_HETBA